jgi:hypothetical protein
MKAPVKSLTACAARAPRARRDEEPEMLKTNRGSAERRLQNPKELP